MNIKLVDDQFPRGYSTPAASTHSEKTVEKDGRQYTLLGESEKTYTGGERVWKGIKSVFKILSILGIALSYKKTKSDLSAAFSGKKVVLIYSSSTSLQKKILADNGNPQAQFEVGRMYQNGEGVERSLLQAFKYFERSTDPRALFEVGRMYQNGEGGVEQSLSKAYGYFQKSADQGHTGAQLALGEMYYYGKGVGKDLEKALKYFRNVSGKKEDRRNAQFAQLYLGWMYEHGEGVQRLDEAAFAYYQQAVQDSNEGAPRYAHAHFALGRMYEEGHVVDQLMPQAIRHYDLGAREGNAPSQHRLGQMYEKGVNGLIEQSNKEAIKYYRLAEANGDELAGEDARRLEEEEGWISND